ncbi:MAG: glycosyltransferase family 39 protein [Acidobacteria bacterium]|nr:glycosyltransferase family 39 protein [Acidobacteriota bacterium]
MKVPQVWRWLLNQPQKNNLAIIEEGADSAKRWRYDVAALLLLAAIFYFFGAGKIALLGPDEPRYAEVAREMLTSGDYVSTRLCGCLWFEKPVLYYWLTTVSYHLFGVNEFAARFASGAMATLTVLALYFALSRAVSAQLARLTALVLLSSAIFIVYARAATPDMALTATMTIAILAGYLASRAKGRAEFGYMTLCFAAMGLGLLAKGLVGVVLVVAILLTYLVIAGRLRFISWRYAPLYLSVLLAVSATWFLPVIVKHGWQFIQEFFIEQHFKRYLTNTYGHPQPFYFFTFIAIVGILPWAIFLFPAMLRLRALRPRTSERDAVLTLAWVWLAIPLVFFSLSESKLPGYLLPVFPALAILVGAELTVFLQPEKTRMMKVCGWLSAGVSVVLVAGFFWYLNKVGVAMTGAAIVFWVLPTAFAGVAIWASVKGKSRELLGGIAAVIVSLLLGSTSALFPVLSEKISLKTLSLAAAKALRPEEKIGFYILKEFAPVFYAQGRVVCHHDDVLNALDQNKLVPPLEQYPSVIFITRKRWLEGLMNDPRFTVEFIAQQGEFYALRVQLRK